MAGYTSRLFTLTIPSIFGFLSILWFLKRRNSELISKAIQVEETVISDKNQYLVFDSMKLKDQVGNPNTEQVDTSEMQLKEAQNNADKLHHCNGVSQSTKIKNRKKGRSKLHENDTTCIISSSCENIKFAPDNAELTNGIEALNLSKDEGIVSSSSNASVKMASCGSPINSNPVVATNGADPKSSACAITAREVSQTDAEINSPTENTVSGHSDMSTHMGSNETNISVQLPAENMLLDSTKPLTLPVECSGAEIQGDMLDSPNAKYCDSVGSNDSGKGASEIQFVLEPQQVYMVYEFEILQELCGLLIGRNGRHVNYIKRETNANILIKRHPYYVHKKVCCITGTEDEIHAALKLIRKRFPVEIYPTVTLSQINSLPLELTLPETLKLCLPEGVSFEAMLCATVNAGHFFLQQPTHPTFHSLPALTTQMTALYSQLETPTLTHVAKGYVCAASLTEGWFRAEVDEVFSETDECRLKFLDYGGYAVVPRSSLRQIRYDFMNVPFQATECYLGNVSFLEGETDWSAEATAAFEELAQGQIVQGYISGYAENRVPYVHLYKITGASNVFINRELVLRSLATWISEEVTPSS